MTKKLKTIPRFETEDQERAFWAKHDATDYLDFSLAEPATFQNVKPSARTISIRLPAWLLEALKVLANKRDVPYQSLMKVLLAEAVEHMISRTETRRTARSRPARPRVRSRAGATPRSAVSRR